MEKTSLEQKKQTESLSKDNRLFNKNFLLLWQGQLVSRLGTQVYSIVIALWLKHTLEASGSAGSLVGSFFMLSAIPMVLFSAFGGAVADRFSRKKIILYGDIFSGLIVTTLGIFLFYSQAENSIAIGAVFVVGISLSTIGAFFGPAISASVPDMVPEHKLPAANSMGQLSQKISVFFGQSLGVPLMHFFGLPLLVIINGITYLISALSESFITIPQIIPEKMKGYREYYQVFKDDLKEGLQYIWKNAGLRKLLFSSVILNFLTMPIIILLMFYVEDFLGASSNWYGFLLAIYGIGALTGFTGAGLIKLKGRRRTYSLITFMLLEPLGYIFMTYATSPFQAAGMFFVGGMLNGFVMVNITTILQLTTPSNIRGRVFGALTTIAASTAPFGMGLGGFLYDLLDQNIALIYISSGSLMFLMVASFAFSKDFRNFIAFDLEEEEPSGFTYKMRYLEEKEILLTQKEIYLEYQIQKPRSEL